jgi:hypothetical protein
MTSSSCSSSSGRFCPGSHSWPPLTHSSASVNESNVREFNCDPVLRRPWNMPSIAILLNPWAAMTTAIRLRPEAIARGAQVLANPALVLIDDQLELSGVVNEINCLPLADYLERPGQRALELPAGCECLPLGEDAVVLAVPAQEQPRLVQVHSPVGVVTLKAYTPPPPARAFAAHRPDTPIESAAAARNGCS